MGRIALKLEEDFVGRRMRVFDKMFSFFLEVKLNFGYVDL